MPGLVDLLLHVAVFLGGATLVLLSLQSAIRVLVLPRSVRDHLARVVFLGMRSIFNLRTRNARTYEERDDIMALYAPVALLTLPAVWLVVVLLGYMAIFWAIGAG